MHLPSGRVAALLALLLLVSVPACTTRAPGFDAAGLFPDAAVQMFRVGEETGTLDDQAASAADFYNRELEFRLKRLTTVFEPAVIIVMGVIVGFVAVALISAMYGVLQGIDEDSL